MTARLGLAAVVAAVVMLCGCGISYFHLPAASSSADTAAPPAATCTLGATGADVQVQITNSVPCGQEIQALAGFGLSWYQVSALAAPGAAGTADGETMFQVCQLGSGGSVLTVMDAGGGSYGQQRCSTEEQDGWEPS